MQISGLQNTSSLFSELAANSTSNTSSTSFNSGGGNNAFGTALSGLMSSIKSGDTSDAQKYLAQLQQLSPSNADSSSPLGKFLTSVSSALASGNISAAQTALTTLQSTPAPGSATSASTTSGDSTAGISQMGTDVLKLFSAISSGNIQDAQSAYDSLTSLMTSASDSTSSNSTSSTSSTSSGNSFDALLAQIGTSLSSGNMTTAQSTLDGFLQSLSAGSLVNASA
jgi:ribosomal protein S20